MPLTRKDVERIARLARLELTSEEKERFRRQLSSILDHVKKLQELDTSHIAATSSVLAPHVSLRADETRPTLSQSEVLQNSPHTEQDRFRVPPIFGDPDA
jgi:aspartyl-tRNA(Asn)/glutamyl-tRNA(Gln) amidotransferase subunit C